MFAIQLPALRDRVDDILPLSAAFLAEFAQRSGRAPASVSPDAKRLLLGYASPGNVRELRNVLERASILCEGELITPEHLTLANAVRAPQPTAAFVQRSASAATVADSRRVPGPPAASGDLEAVERTMIEQALQRSRFNKSKAARTLGLTRQQLYLRMRRYGLD